MMTNRVDVDKIEDMLWTLNQFYQDRARFVKSMYQDMLFTFDRLDN